MISTFFIHSSQFARIIKPIIETAGCQLNKDNAKQLTPTFDIRSQRTPLAADRKTREERRPAEILTSLTSGAAIKMSLQLFRPNINCRLFASQEHYNTVGIQVFEFM